MVRLFLTFILGVTQQGIDAGWRHCIERPASHRSLPVPRSRRVVRWLLLPRRWFFYDDVLHLHLYSSVCPPLRTSQSFVLKEHFGRIMTVRLPIRRK